MSWMNKYSRIIGEKFPDYELLELSHARVQFIAPLQH